VAAALCRPANTHVTSERNRHKQSLSEGSWWQALPTPSPTRATRSAGTRDSEPQTATRRDRLAMSGAPCGPASPRRPFQTGQGVGCRRASGDLTLVRLGCRLWGYLTGLRERGLW
jgi:hypothetical protein